MVSSVCVCVCMYVCVCKVAGSIPVWGSEIVFLRTELDKRSSLIQHGEPGNQSYILGVTKMLFKQKFLAGTALIVMELHEIQWC